MSSKKNNYEMLKQSLEDDFCIVFFCTVLWISQAALPAVSVEPGHDQAADGFVIVEPENFGAVAATIICVFCFEFAQCMVSAFGLNNSLCWWSHCICMK